MPVIKFIMMILRGVFPNETPEVSVRILHRDKNGNIKRVQRGVIDPTTFNYPNGIGINVDAASLQDEPDWPHREAHMKPQKPKKEKS